MITVRKEHIYMRKVSDALAVCQLVEFALKEYLSAAFSAVKTKLCGRLAFNFTRKDYADASMGRLIQLYSRFSANRDLAKRLNGFRTKRNYVAHQAINDYWNKVLRDSTKHRELLRQLRVIEDEGIALMDEIYSETEGVKPKETENGKRS
jgi:hypothetical protein